VLPCHGSLLVFFSFSSSFFPPFFWSTGSTRFCQEKMGFRADSCPYELWLTTSGAWQLWLARIPGLTQALHRSTLSHQKACRDATSDLLKQCKNQHLSQSDWTKGREKRVSPAGKIGIWHCAAALFSQIPKKCTDLDLSLLYILISGTSSKFARKINFLALGVYCPAGQSVFCRSRPQLKLGEEIESSTLVDD